MTSADGGVEVTARAIGEATASIALADGELQTFGSVLRTACSAAAAAAGTGPLAGALESFGEDVERQAKERGAECRELAQGVRKTLDNLTVDDDENARNFATPSFGGVEG